MEKVMTDDAEMERSDVPITEDSLISLEKLDRDSPELWPEQSISKFVAQNSPQTDVPVWATNLTSEDMNHLYQLGHLSMNELITEVKKLHDMAYQLGLDEAKEMTRGKYLNIFKQK